MLLFGQTAAGVRAIDLATVPLTSIGLYWLGKRLANRRVAFLAAVIFPTFYLTEHFASLTQSDTIVTLPMTWAVVCAMQAADSPRASRRALLWSFATGALCAATLWFKHYFAFFVIALVLNQVIARRAIPFKEGLAFSAGGLLFGGSFLVYLLSRGAIADMLATARGAAGYTASGAGVPFVETMLHYFAFRWQYWGVLLVLAALWPVTYAMSRRSGDLVGRPYSAGFGWLTILLWFFGALAFLLIQAKGFDTHWYPLLPPLTLFAADSASKIIAWVVGAFHETPMRRNLAYALATAGFVAILAGNVWGVSWRYITGQESQLEYFRRFQANDVKPDETLQVVEFLKQNATPGDTLFIWGLRAEVYFLSGLRPATRFVGHVPLVGDWYPPEWKQENVDTLWAALPPYVLVMQADYMPWVLGTNEDSHQLLVKYTDLSDWLAYNYERDSQIGDFIIWRRKS
jgi:4-amino-4-deoxy-L-arabinose transferase-like glycosyltransferase